MRKIIITDDVIEVFFYDLRYPDLQELVFINPQKWYLFYETSSFEREEIGLNFSNNPRLNAEKIKSFQPMLRNKKYRLVKLIQKNNT